MQALLARAVCRFLFPALLATVLTGCGSSNKPIENTEPPEKTNLTRLFNLYKYYVEKNSKGPPDEQALRDFAAKLTAQEREDQLIGEDLTAIFVSPRDKQPYVVVYNKTVDMTGEPVAIAWESSAVAGMRYVALSLGYVEEYDDETFASYKK